MGVYYAYEVICAVCEGRYSANLVNSVNVTRFPALKTKLLQRTLNRARCRHCGNISIIEKPFFYSDFKRKQFIAVYPRKERHFYRRASEQTRDVFSPFAALKYGDPKKSRVVFGLEELREKVVAADHEIDDHVLELLKLYVIREHPFLIDRKRMRITLNALDTEKVEFYCTFDLDRDYFIVNVPRAFLGTLRGATPDTAEASSPFQGARRMSNTAFAAGESAPWVNLWRLNPSNEALSLLSKFAQDIRSNVTVHPNGQDFERMLKKLPSGDQLPGWAKRDLQTIDEFARRIGRADIQRKVFEIRFGFGLDSDWFKNADEKDVKTIWGLLKNLPDIAVEGNTWIKAIYLDTNEDGGGTYDPSDKEIHIGSNIQSGTNVFRNVVLHEVGHAVQEKFDREKAKIISKWMESFGWKIFEQRSRDIDSWIDLMGGYPAGTSVQIKTQVRSYIQQSIGKGGTFEAAEIVNGPKGHLWNDKKFGPRRAFELTKSDWFNRCNKWHSYKNKRFFVNYHYQQLIVVDERTVKLIASKMPDRYAAMSPFEFFAELFAWYYDHKSPKRSQIPRAISAWFKKNIGSLELSAPFAPQRLPPQRRRAKK